MNPSQYVIRIMKRRGEKRAMRTGWWFVVLLAVFSLPVTAGQEFPLRYERLEGALAELSESERSSVNQAIVLIRRGEHSLALVRLTALNRGRPQNSSLRILASYAFLQLGNLVGAFEEAKQAHASAGGNSYKCWFLAKVALLHGKKDVCERELEHVRQAGDMAAEAELLARELTKN